MSLLRWPILALLAFATGFLYTRSLIVHPLRLGRLVFLATLCLALLVAAAALWFRGRLLGVAAAAALGLFVAGWWAMSLRFMATPDPRASPELTRQPGDPGLGKCVGIQIRVPGTHSVAPCPTLSGQG